MNDKPLSTLASMKYPKGTRLIASDQWEPFADGLIVGYTADGRYKVDTRAGSFDATGWYLETYYTIELPKE